jgi:hypothetical protein
MKMSNKSFMYRDLVGRLSRLVNAELLKLEVIYNFDLGDEFEVALCHILSVSLPDKYGVCRGHIVTKKNETAGDDIIVFDRESSPTLRMLPKEDFSIKEYIPVESVYAYIEAKHTLYLDGDGNQSIVKASRQVESVKKLEREPRSHYKITDNLTLESKLLSLSIGGLEHPEIQNPLLGCIFSRYVAWNGKKRNSSELNKRPRIDFGIEPAFQPEIIVAGNDMIGLPAKKENHIINLYLFRGTREDGIQLFITEGRAIALGIISLLHSIDTIRLNRIDWASIIIEQLNRKSG